jgi:hypothetical protein
VSIVIDDRDVWQAAMLMVKRYKEATRKTPMLAAPERADQSVSAVRGGPLALSGRRHGGAGFYFAE